MSTETKTAGMDSQLRADAEAVLRHAFHGQAMDPEISRRVQERAARVIEKIYRVQGEIATGVIGALFHDEDET